ncbi:cell wall-binding protein [Anaerococcus murdochii]|uniref:Cell wall-binding protein n=1 Tax=Anaerococcus murdochii TaxID=411577 RepID=A0ABS7SXZ9_9FIRM|nr:peptidoglycan amidohydrolase family protein [Anaerococcus murdochii]MBZ2386420.1 cell wall-binding protein [Anaerococcus murdochii]
MKKINKTVLLASTLFITSAINLADNAYANEDEKLFVKESVDKLSEDSEDFDKNQEIETKSYTNLDSIDKEPSLEDPDVPVENEDKAPVESLDQAIMEISEENPKENTNDENTKKERIPGVIYYDNESLDNLIKEAKNTSKEVSELQNEQTNLDEENYYTGNAGGYFVKNNNKLNYYRNNKLVKNANIMVNGRIYRAGKTGTISKPKNRWLNIGNDIYYNDSKGNILKGISQIGKQKFYFSNDGVLQRNKKIITEGVYYEVDRVGKMNTAPNRWVNVNNTVYRTLADGKLAKGVTRIGNKDYMFSKDGVLQKNKKMILSNKYYEVDQAGVVTNPKNTWFALEGITYRTLADGSLAKGPVEINGNSYVFNYNTGAMITGRPSITNGLYFNIDNKGIATTVKDDWVTYEGKTFHTNSAGYVQKGLWEINGNLYFFNDNGMMVNSTFKQNGIIYKTDEKGIARISGYEVVGDRSIDSTIEWMFKAKNSGMTYHMGHLRKTEKAADCSSAVFRALIYGGFLKSDAYVGNTETLFSMGDKGDVMYEIRPDEIDYGDIFVAGVPGKSLGEGGHTGFILNKNQDTIIHMNYSGNGVTVTPRVGNMGDKSGRPVKYYRLKNAKSNRTFVNKK